MYNIVIDRIPYIRVQLQPGVYTFDLISASGKTYLSTLIKRYRPFGENMISYSYEDYASGIELEQLLKDSDSLLMIDRYDIFNNKHIDSIIDKLKEKIPVLVDCKDTYNFNFDSTDCKITLSEGGITVSL